jgi:hypothetical protein
MTLFDILFIRNLSLKTNRKIILTELIIYMDELQNYCTVLRKKSTKKKFSILEIVSSAS